MTLSGQLPQQFGRYQIVKLLGSGAMGSVYLARDTQLERDVALKVPQFAEGKEPQILARFYQEARAAATIQHPHVCPVFDVSEIDGIPYLTMAFIEGKPLEEWVSSGKPLSERQIATIGRKVADALSEAHKKGVIHRDLKPANIMIDKRGEPIVMDFGLAQRARDDNTRLTRFGTVMGSPSYMSPEQIKGETNTTGPGTDVFSLGVILYELLARRLPFDGDTVGAVHAQILMEEPPPLRQFCPDVSPALEAVCTRALAKKAENRYASMAQMSAAIRNFLNGAKTAPNPAPAAARPPAPPPPPPAPVSSALHGSAFGGRSMVLAQQEENEARRAKPNRKKKREKATKFPTWAWIAGVALVIGFAVELWPSKPPSQTTNSSPETKPEVPSRITPHPMPHDPNFHPIFNGKDTTGWILAWGPEDIWRIEKGELTFDTTKAAGFLKTSESFTDFILRFEFQISPSADCAVVLRTKPGGPKELIVKLNDDSNWPHLGAIWDWKDVDHRPPLHPPEGWNWMEIELRGKSIRVSVNGAEVNKASIDDPASAKYFGTNPPLLKGQIGFQAIKGTARFKNIVLKDLTSVVKKPE